MTRKRIVIGNWKMYIESAPDAKEFARMLKRKARGVSGVEIALAVPAPFIAALAGILESSPVRVGAQAVSGRSGAHSGEVSGAMIKSAGGDFAIVGHSERRATRVSEGKIIQGDTNELVHAQLVGAASAGLSPVLCVGELERNEDGSHVSFVAEQLRSALSGAQSLAGKLVVAYEPVWAIGKTAVDAMKPAEVREMTIFIRKTLADVLGRKPGLRVPILYGGSVEPENASALIVEGDVAGFLVGHASVDVVSFVEIVKAASKST
ncbi:MAG: triose-phosphate isomerase [Patescibacteria group bacterium]